MAETDSPTCESLLEMRSCSRIERRVPVGMSAAKALDWHASAATVAEEIAKREMCDQQGLAEYHDDAPTFCT